MEHEIAFAMRSIAAVCLALAGAFSLRAETLCATLARIGDGGREHVVLSGIYETSFENATFFDPGQRVCPVDVQPVTAVEFAPALESEPAFDRLIARDHRASVTFQGTIEGPAPLPPDDPSLPVMLSYMKRIGGRRYGHMYAYRTRFVVDRIVRWSPVPATVPRYAQTSVSHKESRPPVITAAALPAYPEPARNAGITGVVVLDLRIEKGRVASAEVRSGERLLADAARQNIDTWRFDPSVNASITTTFVYALERRLTGSDDNPRIEMHLPDYVKVIGAENGW
jgi:TonB family protein